MQAPRLAVFPKAFMDALCVDGSLSLEEWIRMAATLGVDGLEFYAGFIELADRSRWAGFRQLAEQHSMQIPMLCCSPDFCNPDAHAHAREVEKQKRWIDLSYALGGQYCRVLSGQAHPEVTRRDGLEMVAEAILEAAEYARGLGITLILENHYKDDYWLYPEFAQRLDVFLELLDRLPEPAVGVNYDPSNALLAGDDPMRWLEAVGPRVVTMHASDRYLATGTLEDLQSGRPGYADGLQHGEIGRGLVDYPRVLSTLCGLGFEGWISIEDGVKGMGQLHRSVAFLRAQIDSVWVERDCG